MIFGVETWDDFWIKNPFWMAVLIIGIVLSIVFFKRGKSVDEQVKSQREIFYGWAFFYLAYCITRILFLFSDIARINESIYYDTYVSGAYIATSTALTIIVYIVEKYMVKNTKRIFTIIALIGLAADTTLFILSFTNNEILGILRTSNTVVTIICGLMIGLLYIYLIKLSTGTLRKNAIISLIGMLIIAVGVIFDMDSLSGIFPMFLSPIITASGAIIFAYGQKTI